MTDEQIQQAIQVCERVYHPERFENDETDAIMDTRQLERAMYDPHVGYLATLKALLAARALLREQQQRLDDVESIIEFAPELRDQVRVFLGEDA